jgi:hypothetical protein
MKRSVTGGCHCGAVRFSCDVDLAAPTVRCNCSICLKSRYWLAPVPAADFRLLEGEGALTEYRFAGGNVVHHFCRTCGIKTFGQSNNPAFGGRFFGVNVACFELEPDALARLSVAFNDGRNDRHGQEPAISSYL